MKRKTPTIPNTHHTQGEWAVTEKAIAPNKVIVHASPVRIALCYNEGKGGLYPSLKEAEANAKIIASAPNLLEVAQMFKDYMDKHGMEKSMLYTITRNAIEKATL